VPEEMKNFFTNSLAIFQWPPFSYALSGLAGPLTGEAGPKARQARPRARQASDVPE